jgi:hypothetical protein
MIRRRCFLRPREVIASHTAYRYGRPVGARREAISMAHDEGSGRRHDQWAHVRFAVVGTLLAAPPTKGDLHAALTALAGPPGSIRHAASPCASPAFTA